MVVSSSVTAASLFAVKSSLSCTFCKAKPNSLRAISSLASAKLSLACLEASATGTTVALEVITTRGAGEFSGNSCILASTPSSLASTLAISVAKRSATSADLTPSPLLPCWETNKAKAREETLLVKSKATL